MKIACTHPGKHGDCLYALPAVKKLCEQHGVQADFYTSDYCAPLKNLFEYQPYIDKFYVAPNYVIERMDMGCQPWYVPVDGSLYSAVYQMGFQRVPTEPIHKFIGHQLDLEVDDPTYEVPDRLTPEHWAKLPDQYITLAPRGMTSYRDLFQAVIDQSPVPVLIVGGKGDRDAFSLVNYHKTRDNTGYDYLSTATIISKSLGFVGLMSSQLVLANGFDIPKVIPHDGGSWDMRHVIYSDQHHYLVNPTAEEVLGVFDAVLQNG